MLKKIYRFLWSFDVQETEEWLSSMAANGLHLVEIYPLTRRFVFAEGDSKEVQYRICFDKHQGERLPCALVNEGWTILVKQRHWYILVNEQCDQIKTTPQYEGVLKHNRIMMVVHGAISAYLLLSFSFFVIPLLLAIFTQVPMNIEGSPYWIIPIFFWSLGFLFLYSTSKLYRSNKRLRRESTVQPKEPTLSHDVEKHLKRSGDLIVIRNFFWRYAPDKLEEWLEKMALEGYHLHRIGKLGITFFFRKGPARKVRYCINYQLTVDPSYYERYKENGWELVFTTHSSWMEWSIWSIENDPTTELPILVVDKPNQLKMARHISLTSLVVMFPIFVIIFIILKSPESFRYDHDILTWIFWFLFGLGIILNMINVMKSLLYYRRVKCSRYINRG